jgi:hypothetical protein
MEVQTFIKDAPLELELGTIQESQVWGYCPNCYRALTENDCIDPDNDTFECGRCDETSHVSSMVTPEEFRLEEQLKSGEIG